MVKRRYLILWVIIATLIMAYILGNYYRELGFYYPKWYSDFLMDTFKPSNAEVAYDLYTYSNFIFSFITSCILAALYCFVRNKLSKK